MLIMSNSMDIGPKKSLFVLVIVIGCFSILWPKVFYPMLVGNANQQSKPNPADRTSGCCDVISEKDIITIKIMTELCSTINITDNQTEFTKDRFSVCRSQVLQTCGIDIDLFLRDNIQMGRSLREILNQVRSINGSLCLKYNFGVDPWRLGVPHKTQKFYKYVDSPPIRQERPVHLNPDMLHPALRERGRAIPASHTTPRVVEGRPGPIPGMRPPMGGPGHVVPPSTKGTSTMSVVMPIYTIGIVIFFTYTLMKLMFKKPVDPTNGLYPPLQPDVNFRKQVFDNDRQYISRNKDDVSTKLGWKERDTREEELNQLRKRLRETELAMERIVAQMGQVPLNHKNEMTANGTAPTISNGHVSSLKAEKKRQSEERVVESKLEEKINESKPDIKIPELTKPAEQKTEVENKENIQPESNDKEAVETQLDSNDIQQESNETDLPKDDQTSVKVLGVEITASCEGGQKWSRPNTPSVPKVSGVQQVTEPMPEPQNIFLEGALPHQGQIMVSDSETEVTNDEEENAVILSGKMTLSVINLDNIDKVLKNGTDFNTDDREVEGLLDEDDLPDLSKYTTASNATAAENDISGDEDRLTDEEEIEQD